MKSTPSQLQDTHEFLSSPTLMEAIHQHEQLRQQLLTYVMAMPKPAFERLTLDLLRSSGYTNVQLADRMDKNGKPLVGGLDMKAYAENDVATSLTIAMVKQYKYPVPRRFVDEIRGTMKRTGAQHGLIISTSDFGNIARTVAASDPEKPVRLIGGTEFIDLLLSHQVGVKKEMVQRLVLDINRFEIHQ